jgi:fructose-bisphosphate aldolase class II
MNLLQALRQADASKTALGHFNFSELVTLKAVLAVARELGVPVVVGTSESERAFIGVPQVVALVRSLRDELGTPIFLNADHTHTLEKAEEAARAGYDSVVFDASSLPFEQNVKLTRQAVVATKSINPSFVVEGEIGNIGSGSEIHAEFQASILSTPAEARQFVEATGVDVLAPAVGTMHGMVPSMLRGETQKHLDIPRIAEIKAATKLPVTLHGASGTDEADLRRAIQAGITEIHINTELRVAWTQGLKAELAAHPDEVAPYHLFTESSKRVSEVVWRKLTLFSKLEKARPGAPAHAPH